MSVPPGVLRGFTTISDHPAMLIAVVGGDGSEGVGWADALVTTVADAGFIRDAEGKVVPT